MKHQLVFVYNADAGFFNLAADVAHKIFSPATYPCHLCDLTHGVLRMRPEWAQFIQESPVGLVFLHRDEFHAQYAEWRAEPLPAVWMDVGTGTLQLLLDAQTLNAINTLEALKVLCLEKSQMMM
jgi:hypothetical protein